MKLDNEQSHCLYTFGSIYHLSPFSLITHSRSALASATDVHNNAPFQFVKACMKHKKQYRWIFVAGLFLTTLLLVGCSDGDGWDRYTISGQVYSEGLESNMGWPDITLTMDGDQTQTTTTDDDGNYSFTVPVGVYRIRPTHKGNTFAPPDNVITVSDPDVITDSNPDGGSGDIGGVDFTVEPFGATQSSATWQVTGSMA